MIHIFKKFAPLWQNAVTRFALVVWRGNDDEKIRNPTGILFHEQTSEALIRAINEFEKREDEFSPADCRKNAERFSEEKFVNNIKDFVRAKMGSDPIFTMTGIYDRAA